MRTELFVDKAVVSRNLDGEAICGDFCRWFGDTAKPVLVLSDGMGNGVKANIMATLTCTILGRMLEYGIPITDCVDTVAATLPLCKDRKMAYSTFSAIQIDDGAVSIVEYDNPPAIVIRNGKVEKNRCRVRFAGDKEIHERRLYVQDGDIIIMLTDGVTHSGIGRSSLDGWDTEEIGRYLTEQNLEGKSAAEIAAILDRRCFELSQGFLEDDRTIAVMRFCSYKAANLLMGPPENPSDDEKLLDLFFSKGGWHVVCGGNTSNMVSRYLDKPINAVENSGDGSVPGMAAIEGVDLVTEGIITLYKTLELCDLCRQRPETVLNLGDSADAQLYKLLFLDSTNINIYFGMAANSGHEGIGIEFKKKLDGIQRLEKYLLEYGKNVKLQYF